MNDFNSLINALDSLAGKDNAAPLRWQYVQARAQGRILLPPPHPINSYGEYELGNVCWNGREAGPFGLYASELPQHIGIFGRTGSGKTNCALLLLQQFLKEKKPFLVFDWKETFRPFSSASSLLHFTPGSSIAPFFLNPFDLDHIPKHSRQGYLRHLLSVLLTVYFQDLRLLSVEGAEYLLLRAIDELSASGKKFTFRDLYYRILSQNASQREKDWKVSVLNLLYKLNTGPIGSVLNAPSSIPIDELAKQQTILELHWLGSPRDKSFLTQLIALQFYYHFSQKSASSAVRFLLLIEEAHNILLRHDQGYETIVEMVLRQIREQGVSICLLDQHPSLMSLPALGTYCTIAFNLRAREDISVMSANLGLAQEDAVYLGQLQTGEAIVKLQDRHLKPFLVRFPLARVSEQVDRDLPFSAGISPESGEIRHSESFLPKKSVCNLPNSSGISPEIAGISGISEQGKLGEIPNNKLLLDIFRHPLSQTIERYQRLGWNPREGNQRKDRLLKDQFIAPVRINAGHRRIKLYDITSEGKCRLRELGIDPSSTHRKGSLLHQFWASFVKTKLKKAGYSVREEYPIGQGKTIDLVAEKNRRKMAIEIETGKSDAIGNVEKCLQAGFKNVVVVAIDRKVKRILEKTRDGRKWKPVVIGLNEIRF
jgi:hypothetical protein